MNLALPSWFEMFISVLLSIGLVALVTVVVFVLILALIGMFYDVRNSYLEFRQRLDESRKNKKGGE